MPRLILLSGPSGSGKSTHRAKLIDSLSDAVVISSDDIIEDFAARDGLSYADAYLKYKAHALETLLGNLRDAIAAGKNIIWDQTNLTAEIRRTALDNIPDSYDLIAMGFEAPLSLILERVFWREKDTGKHIPEDIVRLQHAGYERPHFDEGFDHVVVVHEPDGRIEIIS